jgi:eukaryotic translation initiation factor 2-alpha kinase 4
MQCDVLVGSFDATILRTTGIEILQELWANDISAELAGDKSSLEDLLSGTKDDGHSWIINVRHDASAVGERNLKIKSIVKDEDFDVRPSELTAWLRVEIRDRGRREGTSEGTKLFRPTRHQDGGASMAERDVEVRVLSTQHRGKKQNRRNIVESGMLLPTLFGSEADCF